MLTHFASLNTGTPSHDSLYLRFDPIDVLASYIKDRNAGSLLPIEVVRVSACFRRLFRYRNPHRRPSLVICPTLKKWSWHLSILFNTRTTCSPFARWSGILSRWRSALATLFVTSKFDPQGNSRRKRKRQKRQKVMRKREKRNWILLTLSTLPARSSSAWRSYFRRICCYLPASSTPPGGVL